jgi:AraC-like DNA-binding protein
MHVPHFTLPAHYIRQIAEQVSSLGVDVSQWLVQSGLSQAPADDVLENLPFPVVSQLILHALTITQEPALGLLVGERLLVNSHGILGYAAMNSSTIRQALEVFERYLQVRTTLLSARHDVQGEHLRILFEEPFPLGDIRRPVLEAVVLTIKNSVDHITMGSRHIDRVFFPFEEPEYADLARDLFKCEVLYGQSWTGFTAPLSVIDLPLKMADPATFREASLICQRELDKLTQQQTLSARVRRIMLEKQNGFPSLNVTARLFHLTPRTLHRRLQDEGTSYKDILEEVRHMLALEHLKSNHLAIQEIAYMLDYTDMANFRRAFKRWEGVAPSEYRASIQGPAQPSP